MTAYRLGRSHGDTVYLQLGAEPSDDDERVAIFVRGGSPGCDPEALNDAKYYVEVMNAAAGRPQEGAMNADVSDGTTLCPVPHPGGDSTMRCCKQIPKGWTADEGHAGGHMWMTAETAALFDSGNYDAVAAISGQPFGPRQP